MALRRHHLHAKDKPRKPFVFQVPAPNIDTSTRISMAGIFTNARNDLENFSLIPEMRAFLIRKLSWVYSFLSSCTKVRNSSEVVGLGCGFEKRVKGAVVGNGGLRGEEEGLALFLRRETKAHHDVAEERFLALAEAGPSRRTRQLRQLHDQLIAWFPQAAENALPDALRLAMSDYSNALRAHSLHRFLPYSNDPSCRIREVRVETQAEAIGAAYVLCGAAVGVRSLAKSWGTVIPGDDGRWAALCEAAAMLVARWRDLRAAIDIWGAEHPDDWEDALRGASTAFCVAIDVIEATGELEEV